MKKKILSMALALVMCLSLMPTVALAADAPPASYTAGGTTITVTKLTAPIFEEQKHSIGYCGEGVFYYQDGNTIYFLDKNGNQTGQVNTAQISPYCYTGKGFHDGLCRVEMYDPYTATYGYGFIDKTGKVVIQPKYSSSLRDFSDGMAAFERDGKWGFINTAGVEVIAPKYTSVSDFGEGHAVVSYHVPIISGFPNIYTELIDKQGNAIWQSPQTEHNEDFLGTWLSADFSPIAGAKMTEGKIVLDSNVGKTTPFVLLDVSGSVEELPGIGDSDVAPEYIGNGKLKSVKSSTYLGIVDTSGQVVLPYLYYAGDSSYTFEDGLAYVTLLGNSGGKGVINSNGAVVIEPGADPYSESGGWIQISDFSDGMSLGKWSDYTCYLLTVNGAPTPTTPTTPATPARPAVEQPSTWAVNDVNTAKSAGILPEALQSGYTTPITRAEFCALAAALYESINGEITERKTFADTTDVNVEKMAAIGVVNGTNAEKNLFSPDTKLTREQAATMLSRLAEALGKPFAETAPTFADNDTISEWAFAAVGKVQANGIMNGVGNNIFSPLTDYTREQSIITMVRMMEHAK